MDYVHRAHIIIERHFGLGHHHLARIQLDLDQLHVVANDLVIDLVTTPVRLRTRLAIVIILITIVVVGILLWAINSFIPMEGRVKSILNVVVIIVLVLWLLQGFGIIGSVGNIHVGSLMPSTSSARISSRLRLPSPGPAQALCLLWA